MRGEPADRLGTLTYAGQGCHDSRQVRDDIGVSFRALRAGPDGEALPYVWVPEWHKTGHGLHVPVAVGRYVPRSLIDAAWGTGSCPSMRPCSYPLASA